MKKICAGFVFVLTAGLIFAGTCVGSNGSGDQDGVPDRDQLRDGSCQEDVIQGNGDVPILLTDDQDQIREWLREQLKDGSCQDAIQGNGDVPVLLADDKDQVRQWLRDQLKDDSCQDG